MFEMLTKMVRSKELFRLITFIGFINFNQIFNSVVLILKKIREFFVTEIIDVDREVMNTLEYSFIFRHDYTRSRVTS